MATLNVSRRNAIRLAGLLGAGTAATTLTPPAARAAFTDAPDIVVFSSPALALPLRRAAELYRTATGVPVHVLAPADRLAAAQIERGERNDVCILLAPVAADLQRAGLADALPAVGTWRNRLVVARLGAGPPPVQAASLLAAPSKARLGVVDPSGEAVLDTASLLDRLGLAADLAGRLAGAVDTGGVAYDLARADVEFGLVFATDVQSGNTQSGDPQPGRLTVAATIPDSAYPPVRYAAVLNRHVLSRNAAAFAAFLATPQARASLTRSGLECDA